MLTSFIRTADGNFNTVHSMVDAARAMRDPEARMWLDLHEPDEWTLALLGEAFDLHPLAIEDCLHGEQRPHIDPYDGYLFIVLYAANLSEEGDLLGTREIAFFCSAQYVITLHHEPIEALEPLFERCQREPENMLGRGMDYLLHAVMDALMDSYQPLLDRMEAESTEIEDAALLSPKDDLLERISNMKTQLLQTRRYLTPMREVLGQLARGEYAFIGKNVRPYFRDVLDHLVRIAEEVDLCREQIATARDLFMTSLSHRTNDTMRTLTTFATLMMPLTLVSGIYGMNFDRLWPATSHPFGFWIVLAMMLSIGAALYYWFHRSRWI